MSKKILTFALAAVLSLAASSVKAQTGFAHGDRYFYGFFLSNEHFTNAPYPSYGFSKQTFSYPADNELIYAFDGKTGIYAATCVEGIYYACPYVFSSSMQEPSPAPVMTFNLSNGAVDYLGDWGVEGSHFKPSDMTYDIAGKRILAIAFDDQRGGTGIYEMDPETGAFTFICRGDGGIIAADATGRVFTIDHEGWLCQMDLTTGKATQIFNTKCTGMMFNQTMEFDHTSGNLIWASNTYTDLYNDEGIDIGDHAESVHLREIIVPPLRAGQNYTKNMPGFDMLDWGDIGLHARFQALYIPYAEGGFDAPAAVDDFKAESNADGDGSELTFTLPTKTFGGAPLTSINGYAIYRDGVEVTHSTTPVSPGQKIEWSEKNPGAAGMFRYDVIVYNGAGDGPKTPAFSFIGLDRPAAPTAIKAKSGDDFVSATVTWTAPTEGYHKGTFKPEDVVYDVKRLPDNYKVAEGIKETTVTDNNFRRTLRYSYEVTARNAQGGTAAISNQFVAGPVKEVPVEEFFEDENSFRNSWMDYDNNNDAISWLFATTLGHAVFGDYEQCAEYIISPTSIDESTKDADEWLVSPPIRFESGKNYSVTIRARSFDPEVVNIHYGPRNEVEGMKKVSTISVEPIGLDENTGSFALGTHIVDLPAEIGGTVACVGIQVATPLGDQPSHFLQISSIRIAEKETTAIAGIEADSEAEVCVAGHDIIAPEGSRVYDLAGRPAGMSGLSTGIYLVTVPSGKTVKVAVR